MRNKKSSNRVWGLLIVLGVLVLGQRLSLETGQLRWRPFGEARHSFGHQPCGIPIHVTLGTVDPRFGFDRLTVSRALAEAVGVWQDSGHAELFLRSDHRRAMTVNLEFDERQHSALQRHSLRAGMDRRRSQLESHEATLKQWGDRIEAARLAQENGRQALARRVRAHESEVAAWNSDDAAARTQARRQALEREGTALGRVSFELGRGLDDLNRDIAAYNRRAHDQRQQSEEYGRQVAQYNTFSSPQPVESGRYSYDRKLGRRIAVFRAGNYNELVWILAHELGHALGLDHVQQPDSVMNSLLHEGGGNGGRARPVGLSEADRAAFHAVCGDRMRRRPS